MRKLFLVFLTLFSLCFPYPVHADIGPKPSIVLNFKNIGDKPCYVTLLSQDKTHGPWNVYSSLNDTIHVVENHNEDVWQAFVDYKDQDNFYFIQNYAECTNEKTFEWTYFPPDVFKVLIYYPESHEFIVSDIYERYAFDSYYMVTVEDSYLKVQSDYGLRWIQSSLLQRMILTVVIEITVAFFFAIKTMKQRSWILLMNITTQLLLNLLLNIFNLNSGAFLFIFHYIWMELLVIIIERYVYLRQLPIDHLPSPKTITQYTITANIISFILGFIIL